MGCTRSLLKTLGRWWCILGAVFALVTRERAEAAFASQFSLSVGEEYSDNIFFRKNKDHDFVTSITPTLTLYYAPAGEVAPTLNLNISPGGQIFARHSEHNNFGDTLSLNGGYTYRYSPRLNFHVSDTLQRLGETRTLGSSGGGFFQIPQPVTSPPPPGGTVPPPPSQNLKDLISGGDLITNSLSLQGSFLYRPDISFTGNYGNTFTSFIQQGGSQITHNIGFSGVYNWQQDHNFHAGYSITIINGRNTNGRNGNDNVVHNFDFGDDYFSNYTYTLPISPTLSVSASSGLSINTSAGGPRVASNTNIVVTKLWETASLTGGVRKGLTPSFGVSGVSDTTSFFANFSIRLTERLTANSSLDFSLYDTKDVNFRPFQASTGLQYLITSWLSSSLTFSHRSINSGAGAQATNLLERGYVSANSIFLAITSRFDLWPNLGLTKALTSPSLTPVIRTPFPTPTSPSPGP